MSLLRMSPLRMSLLPKGLWRCFVTSYVTAVSAALVAATVLIAPVYVVPGVSVASAWDLEELNRTVSQTNFILDDVCSATLISLKYRLVVTNYHCVENKISFVTREEIGADGKVRTVTRPRYATVVLSQRGYRGYEQVGTAQYLAEIVAHRKTRDLALVQIKQDHLPHTVESRLLPEGKTMARGERVWAVGNPAMLDATVSSGVISSLNRTFNVPWADNERLNWIQFTAPIHGGNSGGALYNDSGEFIGLPAASYRGEGSLNFAVPVHYVRELLRDSCFASVIDSRADDAKCRAEKAKAAERTN